jgi:hypothetical protein
VRAPVVSQQAQAQRVGILLAGVGHFVEDGLVEEVIH